MAQRVSEKSIKMVATENEQSTIETVSECKTIELLVRVRELESAEQGDREESETEMDVLVGTNGTKGKILEEEDRRRNTGAIEMPKFDKRKIQGVADHNET